MKLLLKLAWRNIWRNRRRSIITITTITFAVMLSVTMRGVQLGTYEVNIRHVVEVFSGYMQIQHPGYQSNPSLQKNVRYDAAIREILDAEPLVTSYTPRIAADGLVSFGENSLGAAMIGIDPQREARTSQMMSRINEGSLFESDTSLSVVVGYKLLQNLKAAIGDEIVILAQGYDGSLGNMKFRISGTVKTGSPEFDGIAVFMGLKSAQDLLAFYGRASVVAIMVDGLRDLPDAYDRLKEPIESSNHALLRWNEVMPDLQQAIDLDNISGILFLGILVIVVAFGITNTVLMSVTERFREFGITLSIGMPQSTLLSLVLLESLMIMLIGTLIGNMFAAGVNYYIVQNPIVFGGDFEAIYAEYGFLPRIESTMRPSVFVNSTLSILGVSLLAIIYPLVKVFKLEPLKGIRYT